MKNIKIIPNILSIILISQITYSLDTVSTKYLPLQVGNVWVYNYIGTPTNSGKDRLKITGTQISNGHKYYVFQMDGIDCHCVWYTYSPFLTQLAPMRIDSMSGNLLLLGSSSSCTWQANEHALDTLKQKIGDPYQYCTGTVCQDTSIQVIFGMSKKTKIFQFPVVNTRTYAQDIGLISSYNSCLYTTSCTYTLQGCVIDGILYGDTGFPVGVKPGSSEIPGEFSLFQNYPNPFNPETQIKYQLPSKEFVKLTVYDILGNEVSVIVNEEQYPGTYEAEWNALNYPSGVYFYELQAGDFTQTRKMTLIR